MDDLVKHIRLSQIVLAGLSVTMLVGAWTFDERIVRALDETQALVRDIDKMRTVKLADYISDRLTPVFHIRPADNVNLDGATIAADRIQFEIVPAWTIVADPIIGGPGLDTLLTTELFHDDCNLAYLTDRIGITLTPPHTRVRFPDELGTYIRLHNSMTQRLTVQRITKDSIVTAYVARTVVTSNGLRIEDAMEFDVKIDSTASPIYTARLCLVQESIQDVIPGYVGSPSTAVGVINLSNLRAGPNLQSTDVNAVVAIDLVLFPDGIGDGDEPISIYEALSGNSSNFFSKRYPSIDAFLSLHSVRDELSIEGLRILLEEIDDIAPSPLPGLNFGLSVRLIPVVGFPILIVLQWYAFCARKTLLKLSHDHNDWSWKTDVGWIHSFDRSAELKRVQEWLPSAAMVAMGAALIVRTGGEDIGCLRSGIATLCVGTSVVVSIRDMLLSKELEGGRLLRAKDGCSAYQVRGAAGAQAGGVHPVRADHEDLGGSHWSARIRGCGMVPPSRS